MSNTVKNEWLSDDQIKAYEHLDTIRRQEAKIDDLERSLAEQDANFKFLTAAAFLLGVSLGAVI